MINNKKKLLAISAVLALLTYHSIDYKYEPNYVIEEGNEDYFATYSKGRVYIGKLSFLRSLSNIGENDILVLDQRKGKDPNMKVINSCVIDDKNVRNEILEILCRYEELHPSSWDRTIESMRVEWLMHNISYFFDFKCHRTRDVDLNNKDEHYYDSTILRKILKL